jgi:hypothetical protein
MDLKETEDRNDCAGEVMIYRDGPYARGSPASEDGSRWTEKLRNVRCCEIHYDAAHNEDREDLVLSTVNCKECELAIAQ